MKKIEVFDCDAETIEKICNDNDMSEHEVIELLLDYVQDMKAEYNLK